MTTVNISGSALPALRAAAADATPSSRKGMLMRKLDAVQPKKAGAGEVYTLEVELKYQNALITLVQDAKQAASSTSEKDAVRRLQKQIDEALTVPA